MPITFGGKLAEQVAADRFRAEYGSLTGHARDPLPRYTGTASELLAVLWDSTTWIEQYLYEMSALARKTWRLQQKIKDPALQDSPQIGAARSRHRQWEWDITKYANDIAELEATCDRIWQALPVPARSHHAMDWHIADPENTDRLIGQVWRGKATCYRWPQSFRISAGYFRALHPYLRTELEEQLADGIPLGEVFEWDVPEEEHDDGSRHDPYSRIRAARSHAERAATVPPEE